MKSSEEKTNVMRVLEQSKIEYKHYAFDLKEALSGVEMAKLLGVEEERVFKTLVTVGKSKEHYVFIIPVAEELDLKKAANACGEKNIAMITQKELLPLTGYVHGGCSPIGMKKLFPTFLDETAILQETICFSAGKIGYQVEIEPDDLGKVIPVTYADLTK